MMWLLYYETSEINLISLHPMCHLSTFSILKYFHFHRKVVIYGTSFWKVVIYGCHPVIYGNYPGIYGNYPGIYGIWFYWCAPMCKIYWVYNQESATELHENHFYQRCYDQEQLMYNCAHKTLARCTISTQYIDKVSWVQWASNLMLWM